jgi:hypothetical protein
VVPGNQAQIPFPKHSKTNNERKNTNIAVRTQTYTSKTQLRSSLVDCHGFVTVAQHCRRNIRPMRSRKIGEKTGMNGTRKRYWTR